MAGGPGNKSVKGRESVSNLRPTVIEALFPVWTDQLYSDKDPADKYNDIAGLVLPSITQQYLDTWKRPEELVQNLPNLPVVTLKPPPGLEDTKSNKKEAAHVSREFEGKLFAGHKTFDWLKSVFEAVLLTRGSQIPGHYLWELIHPRDAKDNSHVKPPSGKYRIKLFIMDTWRAVTIDDRIPVDLFGRPLLISVLPLALWPLLLTKAILKVQAALRLIDCDLPHHVAAFTMITGWPQENLRDPLCGVKLNGGFLFDRLEDSIKGQAEEPAGHPRQAVATVTLRTRALPPKPPPRIIVLSGPSAVGRGGLIQRLISEFPDKFGVTVSHTSRPPKEHEVHGQDYIFSTKAEIRALREGNQLLECAPVVKLHQSRPSSKGFSVASATGTQPPAYLYAVSITTVREVAATGKLCVMAVDEQGVEALQANKRIDGLYVYVAPPSLDALESRIRARLKEAESTIQKRLTWAAQQTELAGKPGVFDHILPNTAFEEVYHSTKEAISTLSPIIRNRLRGLPAYVLDYSDLIPPNMVEKPFLKPVVLSGPTNGERLQLMQLLVKEFPDVFAFPKLTTTRPADLTQLHQLTQQEMEFEVEDRQNRLARMIALQQKAAHAAAGGGLGGGQNGGGAVGGALPTRTSSSPVPWQSRTSIKRIASVRGSGDDDDTVEDVSEWPESNHVSEADFDAAVASGQILVQYSELFRNPIATYKVGVTSESIKEVIKSGKLPLLDLEVEGVQAFKSKGIDFMSIFLAPDSMEDYKSRLTLALQETEEEVAARMQLASQQSEQHDENNEKFYDVEIVNDSLDTAYEELKHVIGKLRPDILPAYDPEVIKAAEAKALQDAEEPADRAETAANQAVLVVAGPAPGRAAFVQQLLAKFPTALTRPALVTDRKPAKGQASDDQMSFVSAKELSKLSADQQLLAQWSAAETTGKESKDAGNMAVTIAALTAVAAAGSKAALIEIPELAAASTIPVLKASTLTNNALYVYVACSDDTTKGTSEAETAQLASGAAAARDSGLYSMVLSDAGMDQLAPQVRAALTQHVPHVVKPPHKPIVIGAPFGTGARKLIQQLFTSLPGCFATPRFTTTKPSSGDADADDRQDMRVISTQQAAAYKQAGAFLFCTEAMGHTYGVLASDAQLVQYSGKVCIIEVDTVETVKSLRAAGYDAAYLFLGLTSMDDLLRRIHDQVATNTPLGYEPDEAASIFFNTAKAQLTASKEDGLFDCWIETTEDSNASFSRLAEAIHHRYPDVVPAHFVYGYGRALWDASQRTYGRHTLQVMVLGPAASGKSSLCKLLAARFNVPVVNVGDLLYAEMAAGTAIGLEAKSWADSSKTVPDSILLQLLDQRLAEPECQACGWILDGFPHTADQAAHLKTKGIQPDKVIMLHAPNAVLLDRTRYRRVDLDTGHIFHLAEHGSLTPAIVPLTPTGQPDKAAMAKLYPRHDDSEENVQARLDLWDKHAQELRAQYEDVSLRLAATGTSLQDLAESVTSFLSLESRVLDLQVVQSTSLKELQYTVVDTLRYRRRQLLKLSQDDGKTFWVDTKEVAGNAHCMILAKSAGAFPILQVLRRLDMNAVPRTALLWVNTPEPAQVLMSLSRGPPTLLEEPVNNTFKMVIVSGPAGSEFSTLTRRIISNYVSRVVLVPVFTSQPHHRKANLATSNHYVYATAARLQTLKQRGQVWQDLVTQVEEHQYAVLTADLEQAWEAGLLPVIIAPLPVAAALKQSFPRPSTAAGGMLPTAAAPDTASKSYEATCIYVTKPPERLDVSMREEGMYEEQELQHQLQLAVAESEQISQGLLKPDHHLVNDGPQTYDQLLSFISGLWLKPREPLPCQVLLEGFSWRSSQPAPIKCRMICSSCSGATLELPRGQHLFRVVAVSDQPHTIMFYSTPPCKQDEYYCRANELSAVMTEMCEVMNGAEGDAAATVTTISGQSEIPSTSGYSLTVMRAKLQLDQPTLVSGTLSIGREKLRAMTKVMFVNTQDGSCIECPSGVLQAQELHGTYTIVAVATLPPPLPSSSQSGTASQPPVAAATPPPPRTPPGLASKRPAAAADAHNLHALLPGQDEPGPVPWVLQLLSQGPVNLHEVPATRSQVFEGTYAANSKCVLSSHILTPLQPTSVALRMSVNPRLPYRLTVHSVPVGQDVSWVQKYKEVFTRTSVDGEPHAASLELAPGKYMLQAVLCCDDPLEGWCLDPITGEIQRAESEQHNKQVSWRLAIMPSTDDKVCPITVDESMKKFFKSLQDKWASDAAAVAAATAAAAASAAAAAAAALGSKSPSAKTAAKSGPGGPAVAAPTGRALAAQTALDRYKQEAAAAAAATSAPEAAVQSVSKTMRDGLAVELSPHAQIKVIDGKQVSYVGDSALEARAGNTTSSTRATEAGAKPEEPITGPAVASKRLAEFGNWRQNINSGLAEKLQGRSAILDAAKHSLLQSSSSAGADASHAGPGIPAVR